MTATAQRFTVGQAVSGFEEHEALPVGTWLHFNDCLPRCTRDEHGFVKREDGWHRVETDGREEAAARNPSSCARRIRLLPAVSEEPATPQFQVGQEVEPEQFRDLPVGTLLGYRPPRPGWGWRKTETGWSEIRNGRASRPSTRPLGGRTIMALPEAQAAPLAEADDQTFTVGQVVTENIAARLPAGAVVAFNRSSNSEIALDSGERWTRLEDGRWCSPTGAPHTDLGAANVSRGYWFIAELPSPPRFTVGQFLNQRIDYEELPDGSVILSNDDEYFAKRNGEWFSNTDHHGNGGRPGWNISSFSLRDYNHLTVLGGSPTAPAPVFERGHPLTAEEFDLLPVGSVVRDMGESYRSGTDHTKQPNGQWTARGGRDYTSTIRDMCGSRGAIRYWAPPPTVALGPDLQAALEVKMREVRDAIDSCVREQAYWGWVARGAFMLLGIDPVPHVDDVIPIGSAFGLPIGSIVRNRGALWQVESNETPMPERIAGTVRPLNRDDSRDEWMGDAQILFLGTHTPPSYTGPNNFLHTVWDKQRELRARHSWCRAVEVCLNNHELPDPGNAPDVAPEPPQPLAAPTVGEEVSLESDQERMELLPTGTLFELTTGNRRVVKSGTRYLLVDSLMSVNRGAPMRVVNIPTTTAPEDPF